MDRRKYIYAFEDGDGKNKMLLGGKGANLCEMTQIGLNVPPGFVISAEACLVYLEKNQLPAGLMDDIRAHMKTLEKKTGKDFGGADEPAARFGALGFGDVHARHDGHHSQSRPERDRAAGADPPDRQ